MNAEIALDIGGTLTLDPTEATGRPSAATLVITKPGSSSVHIASTAATIDTINTTLSTSAAAGAQTITLTATTGFAVGRVILLTNAAGQHEWCLVTKLVTSTKVATLAEPLEYTYASADTVVSNRLTYAVSAANAATEGEAYKVRWTYTIASVVYYRQTFFDVVRTPWPTVILRPDRFKRLAGKLARDILQRPGLDGRDFEEEIAEATIELRKQIIARGKKPSLFLSFDQFEEPIAYGVIKRRASTDGLSNKGFDRDEFDHWNEEYAKSLDLALAVSRTYDTSDDGHVDGDEADTAHSYIQMVR